MADTDTNAAIDRTRQRLEEELAQLRARRRALAAELGERDSVGDRADQADVLEQADDIVWLDERIAEVAALIARAEVPEPAEGRLPHGAQVTLRFDDGEVSTLRVVAIAEEVAEDDGAGAVTLNSPLGRALAGSRVGDVVEYVTPSGPALVEVLALHMPGE
ncbi:MAG: GreA/GreB family elongation factor [Pseudonocardiales bacterium]|nr:GreA/GreB family elongation factor [Pseudonocardiales bacterium]